MPGFFYYLTTIAESGLSIVGIRSPYEQPPFEVIRQLAPDIEIRSYAARTAVETDVRDGNDGEAFGRLFRYITGGNHGKHSIAMTVPVEQSSQAGPVARTGSAMRFFLPASVAADPPAPRDPAVRIVRLPAESFAVIRYSGVATDAERARELAKLQSSLKDAGLNPQGQASYLSYDPPFALPFVRRNEVALPIAAQDK